MVRYDPARSRDPIGINKIKCLPHRSAPGPLAETQLGSCKAVSLRRYRLEVFGMMRPLPTECFDKSQMSKFHLPSHFLSPRFRTYCFFEAAGHFPPWEL